LSKSFPEDKFIAEEDSEMLRIDGFFFIYKLNILIIKDKHFFYIQIQTMYGRRFLRVLRLLQVGIKLYLQTCHNFNAIFYPQTGEVWAEDRLYRTIGRYQK
jgi:hypothetical protein